MRLEGKVAVVTGSARGIGKATALRFAEEGAKLVISDVNFEGCQAVKEEIERMGGSAIAVRCDVTDRLAAASMMAVAVKAFGKIDILVNNAAILSDAPFMEMTDEKWDTVMNTNLKSMFICTQEACKYMIPSGYGRIVCISSITANAGSPGQSNYASAKAGIMGFVKSLNKELPRKGITINAVSPGFTYTDMTNSIRRMPGPGSYRISPLAKGRTPGYRQRRFVPGFRRSVLHMRSNPLR